MKTLREHIKNSKFSSSYLLCGQETYLKNLYQDKLIQAMVSGRESMNFALFDGPKPDLMQIRELGDTPPFLEERRLLVIRNSGLFKTSNELANYMAEFPESTHLLFVDSEVDKRNQLYKYIKEHGTIAELNGLEEKDLKLFIATTLKKYELQISERTIEYFLECVGHDMVRIANELDKLSSYCTGKRSVEVDDIDAICTIMTEGRIFKMMDAIMERQTNKALELYSDLLMLHEKPMGILYMLTRSFAQFAQVTELSERGMNANEIAQRLQLAPFVATKYARMRRGVSYHYLLEAVNYGTELERKIKMGDLDEYMAVEMYLLKFSRGK